MMDIDFFKKVNDTHGHPVGDLALAEVARRIKASVRTVDVVARYGGEEFVVLMPETPVSEARQVAERARSCVEASPVADAGAPVWATVSVGVAELDSTCRSLDELIRRADIGLYAAIPTLRSHGNVAASAGARVPGDCGYEWIE